MSDVRIELGLSPHDPETPDLIRIKCEAQGFTGTHEVHWPGEEIFGELDGQVRLRDAPLAAAREMSALLGRLLFGGDAGAVLREALSTDPEASITLTGSTELLTLPWELARDPETGHAPVMDGAALVRVCGEPPVVDGAPRRGLLAIPSSTGAGRLQALTAVTRQLARKASVDVFPSDPVTGLGLRRGLSTGALFLHFTGAIRDGAMLLDDGKVPLERTGLGEKSWLVVALGVRPCPEAGLTIRRLGAPLVVVSQRELAPNEIGAFNQMFYKALAGGASMADAMRAGRARLLKASGAESFAWAAPALWSAPGNAGVDVALEPFPPPPRVFTQQESLTPEATRPAIIPAPSAPVSWHAEARHRAPGRPIPAPTFIHDTLRQIQDATMYGAPTTPDLDARVEAMRALGTGTPSLPDAAGLSPAERTARLADHLVDAIGAPDAALTPPADLRHRASTLADELGVDADSVVRAAYALLAHRAVAITGSSHDQRGAVARAIAEMIFERHPLDADASAPIVGLHRSSDHSEAPTLSGWGWHALSAQWRRDEMDPLSPGQPDPHTRIPTVVQSSGASPRYDVRRGVWAVVSTLPSASAERRGAIYSLLRQSALLEELDGHRIRVPVSRDFRVIFTCSTPPADLPADVPVVRLASHLNAEQECESWIADISAFATAIPGGDAHREASAALIRDAVARLRAVAEIPWGVGRQALALAIWSDAPPEAAVDDALATALSGHLPAPLSGDALILANDILGGHVDKLAARCREVLARSDAGSWKLWQGFARLAVTFDPDLSSSLRHLESLWPSDQTALLSQLEVWRKSLAHRELGPLPLPKVRLALQGNF